MKALVVEMIRFVLVSTVVASLGATAVDTQVFPAAIQSDTLSTSLDYSDDDSVVGENLIDQAKDNSDAAWDYTVDFSSDDSVAGDKFVDSPSSLQYSDDRENQEPKSKRFRHTKGGPCAAIYFATYTTAMSNTEVFTLAVLITTFYSTSSNASMFLAQFENSGL